MFTLRLLGGLRLENGSADPTGRATQRLRLAILAVIALAPGRRLTRDRLLAVIWPEASADEGRRRLSSALYDLRRLLGEQAIGGHGDELWLDPAAIRVDVEEFLSAVQREEWDRAATLYVGPLLDGVHSGDSIEFEEWLTGHRERLQRVYLGVMERLGVASVSSGDWTRAAERWQHLVELEPLAGRWTLELMRARAALNDRAGAIRAGAAFEARLTAELGIAADPTVVAFLGELRAAPAGHGNGSHHEAPGARLAQAEPDPTPPTPPVPVRRSLRRRVGVVAAGAALVALATLAVAPRGPAGSVAPAPIRVAVFPFAVTGDSGLRFLRDGLVDLLSADLEGVGRFTAVDPHALLALVRDTSGPPVHHELARRLGATRFVLGQVFGLRDSVRLQAALHDAATGALLHEARAAGPLDAVPGLVDQLTVQLAAAEFGAAGERITSVAALTTRSVPALRAFLSGESAFRRGRFGEAVGAYRRAVVFDTSFALAHYRLGLAILWGNQPGAETAFHDSLALRHAGRLSERDRGLVEAYAAWRAGRAEEALGRYTVLTTRHPDDVEAWYQRGESEFHYGPQLGRAVAEARVSFTRVTTLDPSHWGARWHLALLDAQDGRPAALKAGVVALLALDPDSAIATEMQLVAGIGPHGGPPPSPRGVGELELFGAGWRRAVYLRDLDGAAQLFSAMMGQGRSPNSHRLGRVSLGQLALARGQWREALARWEAFPSAATFEMEVLGAIIPGFERPESVRREIGERLGSWIAEMGRALDAVPEEEASALGLQALLAAAADDTAGAQALARRLEAFPLPARLRYIGSARAAGVRAYLAYRQGRPEGVLTELGQSPHTVWYGHAVTSAGKSRVFERFLLAEALRALRRPAEALAWYATFDEHAVHDLIFLVPALLRSAEVNEGLGRRALAAGQMRRATELWRDAEPEYRALLAGHGAPRNP